MIAENRCHDQVADSLGTGGSLAGMISEGCQRGADVIEAGERERGGLAGLPVLAGKPGAAVLGKDDHRCLVPGPRAARTWRQEDVRGPLIPRRSEQAECLPCVEDGMPRRRVAHLVDLGAARPAMPDV